MSILSSSEDTRDLQGRVKILRIAIVIAVSILTIRLWYLQVIRGAYFYDFSRTNSFKSVPIPAPRGKILDRYGIILADNRPAYQVVLNRQYVQDWNATQEGLSKLLRIPAPEIQSAIRKARGQPRFRPIVVRENLTATQLARVEVNKLFFPGVETTAVPIRNYPFLYGTFHLLGYLGEVSKDELSRLADFGELYKQGDWIGKSGIEKLGDAYIRGIDGGEQFAVDAFGRRTDEILFVKELEHKDPVPGNDIVLTIDADLQALAHEKFLEKGHAGSAIMMDVHDGGLLVLYSAPGLDPGMFARGITVPEWRAIQEDLKVPLLDKSIAGQYPPGSTWKMVTAAAGLLNKEISPEERISCSGQMRFGNRNFRCWKATGHGPMNMHDAIVQSCDVYFYRLGLRLGVDRLAETARQFGFGSLTGLGINNEQSGLVPDTEWKKRVRKDVWHEGETLSVAIGQGQNLVTPIQMVRSFAALVNGGQILRPRLIDRVVTPEGKIFRAFETEIQRDLGISPHLKKSLRESFRDVVQDPRGTAYWTRLPDVIHGGKTGTAQIVVIPQNRRVKSEDLAYLVRDHAWFVGFAPADEPEVAAVVMVEHGGHGSTAAAPIVRDLFKAYFDKKKAREAVPAKDAAEPAPEKSNEQAGHPPVEKEGTHAG